MPFPTTAYFIEPALDADQLLEVQAFLEGKGASLQMIPTDTLAILKCKELLVEYGPTCIVKMESVVEAVIPHQTPRDVVVDMIHASLARIAPTKSLILIDPYLFPKRHDHDYLEYLLKLLEPALQSVESLLCVTDPRRGDAALEAEFMSRMEREYPSLNVSIKKSGDFHDRFWITEDARGLFVGSSPNGLGRRFCLVDVLSEEDVSGIVRQLAELP